MLYVLFLLSSLVACTEIKIKPDPSLSAVQANYPTAEFIACGKRWHGLGICPLYANETLDEIQLQVQGYFSGDIRVFASSPDVIGCKMDYHTTYEGTQLVTIPVPQVMSSCTFSISVAPKYPNQEKQFEVNPKVFSGFLRVRRLAPEDFWSGEVLFTPEHGMNMIELRTGDRGSLISSIRGCGINFDGTLDAVNGKIVIDLNEKGLNPIRQLCTIEGIVFSEPYVKWSRLVAVYDERYDPLPKPAVIDSDNEITVYADSTVSAIFLDNDFKLWSVGEFPFDSRKAHVLRLITTSARSVIGEYNPLTQSWTWK